ncbi:MAG: hypothetical protein WD577_09195 [Bacteroidales bacterium]
MDKLKQIRNLLDRFYEGITSKSEERELENFFLEADKLPEEFLADNDLFRSMASLKEPVDVPTDLNIKLIDRLDTAARSESRTRRIGIYSLSGLAAGLLVLLSVYLGFIRDNHDQSMQQYAIEDPEIAYIEAKGALEYISSKWNTGTSELDNLHQINKGMETVSTIRKFSSGSRELNLLGNLEKADHIQIN